MLRCSNEALGGLYRIMAQFVVIVQILISERSPEQPLPEGCC